MLYVWYLYGNINKNVPNKKSFIEKSLEKHLIHMSSLDFYLLWDRKADLTVPTEQNMRFKEAQNG